MHHMFATLGIVLKDAHLAVDDYKEARRFFSGEEQHLPFLK